MRVLYFSDVHIETRERGASSPWCGTLPLGCGPDLSPFAGAVDLLVLAGDIGRVHSTRNVSPLTYAEQAAGLLGCPVVLVPGNHEYYRGSFDEDRAALLTARRPGVTVLDRGEVLIASDTTPGATRLRVLGATLWTDYAATGDREAAMEAAGREILDHRLIRRQGGAARFLPADALSEHLLSREWLAGRLAEPYDGPTLVVTHHVPHLTACHPHHGLNALMPAFCSDCDDLIEAASRAGAAAWIFGHHHWSHRLDVYGVKLLAAQPGYPGEDTGWTGPGVLTL
jgi:predicted MPP superfamily phosphohydrolase